MGPWNFKTLGVFGNMGLGDHGTLRLWDHGTLGPWDFGTMGLWDHRTLGQMDFVTKESGNVGLLNQWSLRWALGPYDFKTL